MSRINYFPTSRPFVISAVILSFIGVSIGTIWMLNLSGIDIPIPSGLFQIHKTIQLEGFLTLLIMGVSYMIIPRFRNVLNPSARLTTCSFLLVIASLAIESFGKLSYAAVVEYAMMVRLAGVLIFAGLNFYTMRTTPKLLKETDYFIAISISVLVAVHIIPLATPNVNSLNMAQLWLLFPIMTIFGVKYKTLPSFLGFMRPKLRFTVLCLASSILSCALGIASVYSESQTIPILFNATFVSGVLSFVMSVYIYGGFDNSESESLMPQEKKARYKTIKIHSKIGFAFLIAGFLFGILFYVYGGFLFYDLAIHYVAIGFIGITIMLFLPLMLPPITGRTINFLKFNKLPLILVLSALALRTVGDVIVDKSIQNPFSSVFGISGLIVLSAMIYFVIMIHRAMESPVNVEFKKRPDAKQ